jgi:hypothetical protein
MRLPRELDPVEIRALNCLLEKERLTPDAYPLAVRLPRRPGRKELRRAQLADGPPDLEVLPPAAHRGPTLAERVAELGARVARLEELLPGSVRSGRAPGIVAREGPRYRGSSAIEEAAMKERRSGEDRRTGRDRRSGTDRRVADDPGWPADKERRADRDRRKGERRTGADRRSPADGPTG